jgi:hypothetical protein
LIGNDCDALIPSQPPLEALNRRRSDANARFRGEYVHKITDPGADKTTGKQRRNRTTKGYRPGRKGTQ